MVRLHNRGIQWVSRITPCHLHGDVVRLHNRGIWWMQDCVLTKRAREKKNKNMRKKYTSYLLYFTLHYPLCHLTGTWYASTTEVSGGCRLLFFINRERKAIEIKKKIGEEKNKHTTYFVNITHCVTLTGMWYTSVTEVSRGFLHHTMSPSWGRGTPP